MDMPIHVIFNLIEESKNKEMERIKKIINKHLPDGIIKNKILNEIEGVEVNG
jgi:hypothetical protein